VLNVCLICSALLIVKVIFVITVFFLFLLCVSTILVNKDDQIVSLPSPNKQRAVYCPCTVFFGCPVILRVTT